MDRRGDGAPERQVFQKAFIQHYDQVCGTGHHGNSLPTVNRAFGSPACCGCLNEA